MSLTVLQTGELHLNGVAYNLSTNANAAHTSPAAIVNLSSPGDQPSNLIGAAKSNQAISVRGRLNLDVQGPRLNTSKAEKVSSFF